jgi:probable phosphoglycerate mutase
MTKIYLIRHGEAEGNIYRRYHGWYNSLITDNGYRQIQALEKRFEGVPIDAVYSSDLFRAMTTAGAIYKPRGLELHTDRDLREIGGGVWEDMTWGELWQKHMNSLEAFTRADPAWQVEGSETFGGLQLRVTRAIRRIAARHDGQTVAVVAHGTAIRTVLAGFFGLPIDQILQVPHGDNTCVAELSVDGDKVKVHYYNDASHLAGIPKLPQNEGREQFQRANLWFRPLDFETESDFYAEARREAWETIHGTMEGFDGAAFLADAKAQGDYDAKSVMVAMREQDRVGILQLDLCRDADQKVGGIPFFYLTPETRTHGLGVQLLGQAVSTYRPLGREFLRLRCAPENGRARRFYERYGFQKIGQEPGGLGQLDVLEKFIGYGLN